MERQKLVDEARKNKQEKEKKLDHSTRTAWEKENPVQASNDNVGVKRTIDLEVCQLGWLWCNEMQINSWVGNNM